MIYYSHTDKEIGFKTSKFSFLSLLLQSNICKFIYMYFFEGTEWNIRIIFMLENMMFVLEMKKKPLMNNARELEIC